MTVYAVRTTCGRENTFNSEEKAEENKNDHASLCNKCSKDDIWIDGEDDAEHDDSIDEMEDEVPVVKPGENPQAEAATDGGATTAQSADMDNALDQDHAKRTEWWAEETTRCDEVRSEILANAMLRDDVQLVKRGTDTDTSGVHELSFTVRVQGVPLDEFEVSDDE